MNYEAVKRIRGHFSSADNLVSSLMSSTKKLVLPPTVSWCLKELGKTMESSAEIDQPCRRAGEGGFGVGNDSLTKETTGRLCKSEPDDSRPVKQRKSFDTKFDDCESMEKIHSENQLRHEYDEGMLVYPNPLMPEDQPKNDCPEVLSALLFNFGQLKLQEREEHKALSLFHLADDILKNNGDSQGCSTIEQHVDHQLAILHQVAYTHFRCNDYSSALKSLKEALSLAEHHYGQSHLSTASALHCIGTVMFHLRGGDYQEMLRVLKQALSTRTVILGNRHKDVATTLNNIGRIYFDCGEIEQALTHYKDALQIRQELYGDNHMDVAATTFNIGQAHHRMGHLDEAMKFYSRFYIFILKVCSRDQHRDLVVALKHMGQVYHEQKDLARAKNCYQEAINISLAVRDSQQEKETASILNIFGNCLYEEGSYDRAAEAYEQGLAIERRVLEPCCINIFVTLSNIGQALMQQSEYRRALCRYTEAYAILSLQPKPDVKKLTETLSIIGRINNLLGNFTQAIKAFQEVISMRKAALGEHIDVALALNYLGLLYFKRGLLDLAMENFEESLRVRRNCSPQATSSDIAVLSYNIGSIYLHRGDNMKALSCYKDALEVERATYGHVHQDVATTLQLIGKVHDQCGIFEEATQHFAEAIDIWKKCAESSADADLQKKYKLNIAKLLTAIASIHLRQGNIEQVQQYLTDAHRIFRDVGVPPDAVKADWFSLYELILMHPHCAAAA